MIQSKTVKFLFSLATLTFLMVGSLGIMHMGMGMSPEGQMSDCPFSLDTSVCTMSPLEHIGAVQSFFTSLPQQNNTFAYFLLFILAAATLVTFLLISTSPPKLAYKRPIDREYIPLHSSLQEAFSRGILNPKIF